MLEICIDGVASARASARGGADRVELCANLPEGGTTPSAGMIRAVRSAFTGGLMVIIRPRGYDFLCSEDEMQVMLHDIQVARELGADGIAIGCLTRNGRVDTRSCERLLSAAGSLDVTFHRAFDMTRSLSEALEDIIALGIRRILTSGGRPDAASGVSMIADLVRQSAGRASIMPGGGVTEENLALIVKSTGVREIHLSARAAVISEMEFRNPDCSMGIYSKDHEYEWREASAEKNSSARKILTDALASR
jgi:copper homeostasis protein